MLYIHTQESKASSIVSCPNTQMASMSTCIIVIPTCRLLSLSCSSLVKPRKQAVAFPCVQKQKEKAVPKRGSWDSRVLATRRPGGIVESDKLPWDVRRRTMDAVDGCGGRVTIGDVASTAGLNLNQAQKALQALAADADGFLEVSDQGDLLYVFPKDYRSRLAAKSFRIKAEPLFEKAKVLLTSFILYHVFSLHSTLLLLSLSLSQAAGEYLIRVSFGTALIASIVIVYTTIIALLTSSRRYFITLMSIVVAILIYPEKFNNVV